MIYRHPDDRRVSRSTRRSTRAGFQPAVATDMGTMENSLGARTGGEDSFSPAVRADPLPLGSQDTKLPLLGTDYQTDVTILE